MSCCIGEVATMEIPLPLSILPPYSSGLEVDDNTDYADVPPSPTVDPPTPNTIASGMFFQRGFVDCAQEALHFLVEKEGMAEDNAVVVGLKEHLAWSSQQFTPASLASPPPPSPSASSIFTFPPSVSQSLVSKSKNSVMAGCVTSLRSDSSVRFAPYSVADSFHSRARSTRPTASVTCPTTKALERVLNDNIISVSDLSGVLRCAQYSELSASREPARTVDSSLNLPVHGARMATHNSSLNDSGLSESDSVDLADEVDGGAADEPTDTYNDVFDFVSNGAVDFSVPVTDAVTEMGDVVSEAHLQAPEDSEGLEENSVRASSPSSQLSLLASLSSGTHRLTSPGGGITAGRIQSLANEILLLLQEEAEAGDEDDEEEEEEEEGDNENDDLGDVSDDIDDESDDGLENEP